MLQTIDKSGSVLGLFTVDRSVWSLSEIAAAIGEPRSTTHALLESLITIGLLQTRRRGRYEVGWRVLRLGSLLPIMEDAPGVTSELEQLSERINEGAVVAVLRRWTTHCVLRVSCTRPVAVNLPEPAVPVDSVTSAVGKVLLANRHPAELRRFVLDRPFGADSDSSTASLNGLADEIEIVRRTGLASDYEQTVAGVCCLAAPIRDAMGRTVAAVGAVVPAVRFDAHDPTLGKATRAAAIRIGSRLAGA